MVQTLQQPKIYIIASQTGTIPSRLIRRVTGARFNHASISLDERLDEMYSFARRHPYNPVWGGYVKEHPLTGTFARFPQTQAQIISVNVTQEQHDEIRRYLEQMYAEKNVYHYNYAGLFLGALRIPFQRKNHYYCSEFVRDVLVKFAVVSPGVFDAVIQPQSLLDDMPGRTVIYDGRLAGYPQLSPADRQPGFFRRIFAA